MLRALIEATAPETINVFEVKSAECIAQWNTRRVTLLGDALHNMTPYRGMGVNMALLDADSLRRALLRVHRGENVSASSRIRRVDLHKGTSRRRLPAGMWAITFSHPSRKRPDQN